MASSIAVAVAVAGNSTMSVLQQIHIPEGAVLQHHNRQMSAARVLRLRMTPLRIHQRHSSSRVWPPNAKESLRDGQGGWCMPMKISCSAAGGSAGNQSAGSDESPYQVLGVTPFEKFDSIKAVYTRRYKDAERRGDEAAMARFEAAYDKLLMAQLKNRKQGRTFGDFEVSKEIRYADKQAWFPWGPRVATSSRNDILINLAGSALIIIWISMSQVAEWKPLQFLLFGYAWRIFMKLANFEPPPSSFSEEDEDQTSKRRQKNGKRLLRTLAFVFGTVSIASLAFTGILNGYELLGLYIPRAVINSQELFVTVVSSVLLFFAGSYFR